MWLWTHILIGRRGLYTGGSAPWETHTDTSQQVVDLAVDDSGDNENDDRAEGG